MIKVFGRASKRLSKRQFMTYSTIFDHRIDAIVHREMKNAAR
jgi:hypothetical protein